MNITSDYSYVTLICKDTIMRGKILVGEIFGASYAQMLLARKLLVNMPNTILPYLSINIDKENFGE